VQNNKHTTGNAGNDCAAQTDTDSKGNITQEKKKTPQEVNTTTEWATRLTR
jgi:hypothetical protein